MPHAAPTARSPRAVLLITLLPVVLASGARGQEQLVPAWTGGFHGVTGHVATTYYLSHRTGATVRYGGEGGVLQDATLSGSLAASHGSVDLELEASDLQPDRQELGLTVRGDGYDGRLDLTNVPPPGPDDERNMHATTRHAFRLGDGPRATLAGTHRRRGSSSSRTSFTAGLSERYRDVAPSLNAVSWRAGYTFGRSQRDGAAARDLHGLRVHVDGDLAPAPERTFRPSLRAQWRLDDDRDGEARLRHRYRLGLALEANEAETFDYELDLDLSGDRAARRRQRVSLERRLHPQVSLRADAEESGRGSSPSFDFGAGVAVEPVDDLELSTGYRGRHDDDRTRHGLDAGVRWRLRASPWTASLRADGDLLFGEGGEPEPSLRLSALGRYEGDELSGSARAALALRNERMSGRLEVTADLERDALVASLASGVAFARDTSLRAELDGRVPLSEAWWLQARGAYRATLGAEGGRVLTVGAGVRYEFGGDR